MKSLKNFKEIWVFNIFKIKKNIKLGKTVVSSNLFFKMLKVTDQRRTKTEKRSFCWSGKINKKN